MSPAVVTAAAAAARELLARLAGLEVVIETAFALPSNVRAEDYPGLLRPSGVLLLAGRGHVGRGEHVAFDEAAQERFASELPQRLVGRRGTVGELSALLPRDTEAARWRRAAVEGALLDLALRQADRSLADLAGAAGGLDARGGVPIRYLVSFDACADPAARLRALRTTFPSARFKVDVDPGWSEQAARALADTGAVAVLDFKGRGDARTAERLAALLPDARIEDPPVGAELPAERVARDQPVIDLPAAARVVAAAEALNLKAPRLGGFLAALEAAALALDAGTPLYLGGMFEVDVGRRQARALAALLCPASENDLAPLRGVEVAVDVDVIVPGSALKVPLDRPGFGR